jgi:hypothetical protein
MNKAEFRDHVYKVASQSLSRTSLDKAVEHCWEWRSRDRQIPRECASECINLAGRFKSRPAGSLSQSDTSLFQYMRMAPHDLIMSDDLAEKIRPAVEQVRIELFGSPHPPFAALKEAIQWLKQTAAEQEAQAWANNQAPKALKQTILDMLEKYQDLTGETVNNPFKLELLEYVEPGNQWVRRMPVWGRTSLATLRDKSKWLADATAFPPASVVAYILADIRPLLAPMSIEMSWGRSNEFNIFRRRATVELHTHNVTDAQLRAIRQLIRSSWGTERKRQLKEEDKQFLDIVQRLGGMPNGKRKGEIKTFYEQVKQEFNALAVKHGYKTHSTWKASRLKHKRVGERVQQGDLLCRQHHTKTELDI